ncbi:MAG: magnesium transporter, partial [Bacteroidales bacterium]
MTDEKQTIQDLVEEQNWKGLYHEISRIDAFKLAELIEELSPTDATIVFRLLPRDLSKEVFPNLSFESQEKLVEELANKQQVLRRILNDLYPDDRTALFEEMPGMVTQRLIQLLTPQERSIATKLLGYPDDSIGRLMTPEYVAIKPHFTVDQTLQHIRDFGRDSETLNVIYVVDNNWKLIDDLRIREILMAKPKQKIEELMDHRYVSLSAFDDQEDAIGVFQDYDRVALPVTDTEGILLGIITFDDVMDVAEEESTEDFHKFGSFQDIVMSPLKAKIPLLYKKRILWLFALVFMNVFSGAALASFEETLEKAIALVFFLPLLIDSGGNAGAQSATLIIRGLATGDLEMKDWIKLVGKEFIVALLLGITMAAGVSLIASFRAPEVIL